MPHLKVYRVNEEPKIDMVVRVADGAGRRSDCCIQTATQEDGGVMWL